MRRSWVASAAAAAAALLLTAPAAGAAEAASVGPGVTYRTFVRGSSRAYVATVTLSAASTPVPVLAQDELAGFETTSSMAGRYGAVLAVNGDFGLSSGRPVHAFATGGVLAQTDQLPGRGLGTDRSGDVVHLGDRSIDVRLDQGRRHLPVVRWNSGAPKGDELAGFTTAGAGLEVAPGGACYAALVPHGGPAVGGGGRVDVQVVVRDRGCGAQPPAVPTGGAVLVARRGSAAAARLAGLAGGMPATLSQRLGWSGSWSLIGGSEQLVVDGRVNHADVDQPGAYVQDPAPRTAVATTADGHLLLVVVDGRQPGYSTGMSLRQLARLLVDLGARTAINLDGGGSSTMWVRGTVVNRPSDGSERAVDSALVVVPGPARAPAAPGPPAPTGAAWRAASTDAASTGGLLASRG